MPYSTSGFWKEEDRTRLKLHIKIDADFSSNKNAWLLCVYVVYGACQVKSWGMTHAIGHILFFIKIMDGGDNFGLICLIKIRVHG